MSTMQLSQMKKQKVVNALLKHNTLVMFILLIIVSSVISDVFLTERNIFNILRQIAPVGIISMGMLMVILTGGIDLSVGSILALASVLSAYFVLSNSLPIALILTVLIGMFAGACSGADRVPPVAPVCGSISLDDHCQRLCVYYL